MKTKIVLILMAIMMLTACETAPPPIDDSYYNLTEACDSLGFTADEIQDSSEEDTVYQAAIFKGLTQDEAEKNIHDGYGVIIWTQYKDEKAAKADFEKWVNEYSKWGVSKSDNYVYAMKFDESTSIFTYNGRTSLHIMGNDYEHFDEFAELLATAGYAVPEK